MPRHSTTRASPRASTSFRLDSRVCRHIDMGYGFPFRYGLWLSDSTLVLANMLLGAMVFHFYLRICRHIARDCVVLLEFLLYFALQLFVVIDTF